MVGREDEAAGTGGGGMLNEDVAGRSADNKNDVVSRCIDYAPCSPSWGRVSARFLDVSPAFARSRSRAACFALSTFFAALRAFGESCRVFLNLPGSFLSLLCALCCGGACFAIQIWVIYCISRIVDRRTCSSARPVAFATKHSNSRETKSKTLEKMPVRSGEGFRGGDAMTVGDEVIAPARGGAA